jgi:hypothetical protein
MIRKLLIVALALSTALAGCASEPPTAGELMAFEAVCDKANEGKRVAVEGYLVLPDEFTDSQSVVLRLHQELDSNAAKIGVQMRFGTEPNQLEEVPTSYSDDDLKVRTADNQVVGYDTLVRVSGKVYFPVVAQDDFTCGLENPLVEVASGN